MSETLVTVPKRWTLTAADVVDVFVYVVVLNLAAQLVPQVMTESFSLSLLTAVMLKVVLEVVTVVKSRARARLALATGAAGKIVGGLVLWAVLVGSKFVVLKVEDLLFGDRVQLGGFFAVTGLIVVLLISREGVRRLLGGDGTTAET